MRQYIAFVKKEFLENIRTYRVLILFMVFFIFGMMSPLFAKLTPEILKSFADQGYELSKIPEAHAINSYEQFFKNNGQLGLIIMVCIFGGTLTREFTKGTLINVLTKGLTRKSVILAKFTVATILWSIGLLISLLTTYGYTVYMFPDDPVYHIGQSVGCLWLFGILLITMIMLCSMFVKNSTSCIAFIACVCIALSMINFIPPVKPWNPLALVSQNTSMLVKDFDFTDTMKSITVTVIATVAFIWSTILVFNKKRI